MQQIVLNDCNHHLLMCIEPEYNHNFTFIVQFF